MGQGWGWDGMRIGRGWDRDGDGGGDRDGMEMGMGWGWRWGWDEDRDGNGDRMSTGMVPGCLCPGSSRGKRGDCPELPVTHSAPEAGLHQGHWAAWRGRSRSPGEGGAQLGTGMGEAAAEPAAAGGIVKPRAGQRAAAGAVASPQPSPEPATNRQGFLLLEPAPGPGCVLGRWGRPGDRRPRSDQLQVNVPRWELGGQGDRPPAR